MKRYFPSYFSNNNQNHQKNKKKAEDNYDNDYYDQEEIEGLLLHQQQTYDIEQPFIPHHHMQSLTGRGWNYSKRKFIFELPSELLDQILSFYIVSYSDLFLLRTLNKEWRNLVECSSFWLGKSNLLLDSSSSTTTTPNLLLIINCPLEYLFPIDPTFQDDIRRNEFPNNEEEEGRRAEVERDREDTEIRFQKKVALNNLRQRYLQTKGWITHSFGGYQGKSYEEMKEMIFPDEDYQKKNIIQIRCECQHQQQQQQHIGDQSQEKSLMQQQKSIACQIFLWFHLLFRFYHQRWAYEIKVRRRRYAIFQLIKRFQRSHILPYLSIFLYLFLFVGFVDFPVNPSSTNTPQPLPLSRANHLGFRVIFWILCLHLMMIGFDYYYQVLKDFLLSGYQTISYPYLRNMRGFDMAVFLIVIAIIMNKFVEMRLENPSSLNYYDFTFPLWISCVISFSFISCFENINLHGLIMLFYSFSIGFLLQVTITTLCYLNFSLVIAVSSLLPTIIGICSNAFYIIRKRQHVGSSTNHSWRTYHSENLQISLAVLLILLFLQGFFTYFLPGFYLISPIYHMLLIGFHVHLIVLFYIMEGNGQLFCRPFVL